MTLLEDNIYVSDNLLTTKTNGSHMNDFIKNITNRTYPDEIWIDYETHYTNIINCGPTLKVDLKDAIKLEKDFIYLESQSTINEYVNKFDFKNNDHYCIAIFKNINKKYNTWSMICYKFTKIESVKNIFGFDFNIGTDTIKYEITIGRFKLNNLKTRKPKKLNDIDSVKI